MRYTIGIDLGGTIIKTGLLKDSNIVENRTIKALSQSGLTFQLPEIEKTIEEMLLSQGISAKEILGIGFSFAGLVNSEKNVILSTNQKYDDAVNIDLVAWAKEKWNLPLMLENDARMALLGEWQHGNGKGYNDFIMLTYGTGIGSAVLMDGKLLHGKHFQSGNLGGHFVVDYDGKPCTCGGQGCVEAEASSWRLPAMIREHPYFESSSLKNEKNPDYKILVAHAKNKDKAAQDILDKCLKIYTAGLISMIHAFDPELIILGGGIMNSEIILPELQARIDKQAWTPWGKVKLVKALHLETAALFGADYLIRSKLLTSSKHN